MAKVIEAMLVDKRIVERNISKGLISKEDYRAHLASLKDLTDAVELVSIETEEDQEDQVEDEAETSAEPAPTPAFG